MAESANVSLKEHLEGKITALQELTKTRFELRDHALQLEAVEVKRRLDHLNNETARAVERDKGYVPREVYEQFVGGHTIWRESVERFIASNTGQAQGSNRVWYVIATITGLAIASAVYFK